MTIKVHTGCTGKAYEMKRCVLYDKTISYICPVCLTIVYENERRK